MWRDGSVGVSGLYAPFSVEICVVAWDVLAVCRMLKEISVNALLGVVVVVVCTSWEARLPPKLIMAGAASDKEVINRSKISQHHATKTSWASFKHKDVSLNRLGT
jgi:hypothetical protein